MSEIIDLSERQRKRDFEALREQVKREALPHSVAAFQGMVIAYRYMPNDIFK